MNSLKLGPTPALQGTHASVPLERGRDARAVRAHRSFDPRVVGELECAAWVAYYRRDWLAFLKAALLVSRNVFGLSWRTTIRCSWLVLRANQLWAPYPANDPATAADLEVEWWRVHRDHQRSAAGGDCPALVDALARLYAHVYGVPERLVRAASEQRALAMRYSDQWVSEGCAPGSPLIDEEREALVRSYSALLAVVRPDPGTRRHASQ
jgi:hypothetical protein